MSTPSHQVSSINRQIYQRLKQALKLNLRRQIFIAVCDDLWLRDCLAARLQAELGSENLAAGAGKPQTEEKSLISPTYPQLISLELNLTDPNPITQIAQWLEKCPAPQKAYFSKHITAVQILGAEHLTRQPAAIQWSFLNNLRSIDRLLPNWQFNLLLWLPRPWLFTIQQSVPEFWRWHTGIFEFEGEPTPTSGKEGEWGVGSGEWGKIGEGERERIGEGERERIEGERGRIGEGERERIEGERGRIGEGERGKTKDLQPLIYPSTNSEKLNPNSHQIPNSNQPKIAPIATQKPKNSSPKPAPQTSNLKAIELAELIIADVAVETDDVTNSTADNSLPLQTLQYIELLHEQQCSPQTLGLAYQTLGNFYRDRILAGDSSRTYLEIAIRAYELAIEITHSQSESTNKPSPTANSTALIAQFNQNLAQSAGNSNLAFTIPNILNDLGTLYWMLFRHPSLREHPLLAITHLEHSIALYQEALSQSNPKTHPQSYARLQKNLGATWGDLARCKDTIENLQHSLQAYEQALIYIDPKTEYQQYAATQNNLGTAYWNLAQHQQPMANLEKAIAAYTQALSYYNPEREPLNYAGVQNNLGTAWWNLAQHEPSETLLLEAVNAYTEALRYRTTDLVPAACAATQNNLGTVYWHLANLRKQQKRIESLEKAIATYQSAIAIAEKISPNHLTFDLMAAYNNLGLAHYQLATDPYFSRGKTEIQSHLEAALQNQLQACRGWQQKNVRLEIANLENSKSLGEAPKLIYNDSRQIALTSIVKTIQAFYSECGLQGQNLALSKIPGDLLPEILPQL